MGLYFRPLQPLEGRVGQGRRVELLSGTNISWLRCGQHKCVRFCPNSLCACSHQISSPVLNMITDIAFATLPVRLIWSLQMKQRQRTYLIFIFSLGYTYGPPPYAYRAVLLSVANNTLGSAVGIGIAKLIFQLTTRGVRDKSL